MANWEYARLSNPESRTDSVQFSHPQRPSIVDDWKRLLDRGLKEHQSNNRWLHVNLNHTNVMAISGILGDEGWELVTYATMSGGHEFFVFQRERGTGLTISG